MKKYEKPTIKIMKFEKQIPDKHNAKCSGTSSHISSMIEKK